MKLALGFALALMAVPAAADSTFAKQLSVLDKRVASNQKASVTLAPPRVYTPSQYASPEYDGDYRGKYYDMARTAARRHDVPEHLFLRLVQQESGWNPEARSHKGAYGLAQLMPQTAKTLGVDSKKPQQNLEGGARYLRAQFEAFGSWRLALAAYNAGPAAVEKYGGVPPFTETRNYVRAILGG